MNLRRRLHQNVLDESVGKSGERTSRDTGDNHRIGRCVLTPQHRYAIQRQTKSGKLETCAHWTAQNTWQARTPHRSAQMTFQRKVWSTKCRGHAIYACPTCGREKMCSTDLGKGLKKCLHLYCRGVEFDVIHVGRHGTVDRGLIVYKH